MTAHAEPAIRFEPPEEVGDYVIGKQIGQGATGAVYVAKDAWLNRDVAIKFLTARTPGTGGRQQILTEARTLARIIHQNVAGVFTVGEHDDWPYIVSELVRGTSLAKVPRPMPWEAALKIATGLASGLEAIHRKNVVHCDLKPANVMIAEDGTPKIIDFGLARVVTEGAASGLPLGTPDYMAPEVWGGEPPGRRADVYSLGAVIFELLVGEPPFKQVPDEELRGAVTGREAPAVRERAPEVDPRLAEVVARCLRRDPRERFASGEELREALEALQPSRRHAVSAGENPYRGLRAFEAAHRGVFFGRGAEIDAVVERLRAEPMIIVTGDSGVGKSSLCRAGVVPAVLEGALGGAWAAITVVPGRRPLDELGRALGDPALGDRLREAPEILARELRRFAGERHLLVFFDQLEELIAIGEPRDVEALDEALGPIAEGQPWIRLLATARADFLSKLAALPRLGRELSSRLSFLRPLPPERIRQVIVGPAEATGIAFESEAIVAELVEATAKAGEGGLPLLSFALADLWEARDREHGVIRRAAVEKIGGVEGALSRHADEVVDSMTLDDRKGVRAILARLVSAKGTRARRAQAEVAVDDRARRVLDRLVKERLLVSHDSDAGPVYEVAHEVLLTGWARLREWLEADAGDRVRRERLAAATAEWLRLGRAAEATWQGERLGEARRLEPALLTDDERAFIAASARAARRRRTTLWGMAIGALALIALAVGGVSYRTQRRLDAEVEDKLSDARRDLAVARVASQQYDAIAAQAFAEFDARRRDRGEQLWKDALVERDKAARSYRTADQHVEAAFAKDPARADVRDLLGDVLLERAEVAEQIHAINDRDALVERLALFDRDGSRLARWARSGRVAVRAPAGAEITLEPGGRLGTGPLEIQLKPGSYVFVVTAPGRAPVRAPVLVERGGESVLDIDPPPASAVPPGFIYIPPGDFLFGNEDEDARRAFFETTPLRRRSTGAFLIGRTEVTFEEWLAFVDAMPPEERSELLPGVPGKLTGTLEIIRDEQTGLWQIDLKPGNRRYTALWSKPIVYEGRTRLRVQDWRRFPVIGVSAIQAARYAAWRGARLCSEVEWERAARGADGRRYPGGGLLQTTDANLDKTYGPELIGPDEVGAHPESNSPFGLADTVGNAFELTISEDGNYSLRGGSYYHDRRVADLSNRSETGGSVRDVAIGVRLCASLPGGSEER